jgi:hypothetical protein
MKKLFLLAITLIAINNHSYSQSCIPTIIIFYTQAQIDNFQNEYPGCSAIEGEVIITGEEILNLNGLNVLTSIGGNLSIDGTTEMTNFHGLDNLTTIGGYCFIGPNYGLTSFEGLNNLKNIGQGFLISENDSIINLSGLEGLTSIGNYLGIQRNKMLTNFTGLNNLSSIGAGLTIESNDALSSLTGIEKIDAASIENLMIVRNNALTFCEVKSICNFISNPNGMILIEVNATGCNSEEEVKTACENIYIEDLNYSSHLSVQPNPSNGPISFNFVLDESAHISISLINSTAWVSTILHDELLSMGAHEVIWDPSGLPAGLYFYNFRKGEQSFSGKIVVQN